MLKRTIVYAGKFLDGSKPRTSKDHTGASRGNYGLYDPDKKQAWIVPKDDFFECTVGENAKEIEYAPVKFYDNEAENIMKRNSIESSRQIKSTLSTGKALKITDVKVNPRWIYETFKGSISVDCKINGKPAEFVFMASRWDSMLDSGIDCNEVRAFQEGAPKDWNGRPTKYESITISNGGGQTTYALKISSSVLTSKPKENQKDYGFTGQYYSTQPVVSEFKSKLLSLYNNGELTEEFINYFMPGENNMIGQSYTRENYDRFDENGEFIPYKPTEEELAKKDEIKKVLEQELSAAYEPDPMDDYAGYDTTNERVDMACERVAKQFGVDTDFVEEIAGEIEKEDYARSMAEAEWIYEHCNDKDKFWEWQNGEDVSLEELGIDKEQMDREVGETVRKYVKSSRKLIKSSTPFPKDNYAFTDVIEKTLDDVDIWAREGVTYNPRTNLFEVDINGDWKHDHLLADDVLFNKLGLKCVKTQTIGDSDSDSYEAIHYYKRFELAEDLINKGIDLEQMRVLFQSKKPIKSALDTVKVTFDNGDTIVTDYNADVGREEIAKYYMGHYFNIGIGGKDEMHKAVKVEFPESITSSQKGREPVVEGTQYDDYYVDTRGMGINHVGDIIEAIERRGNQAVLTVQCSDGTVQHTYFPLKAWKEYKDTKNNAGTAVTDVWITEVEGGSYIRNSREIESSTAGELDEHGAEDLELYAENTAEVYHRFITPTRNNLRKKVQNGTYDENKALKAWENVIDEAAKMYDKELGSGRGSMTLFNKSTRHEAAKRLMERMDDDVFQGLRKIESCRKPRKIKSAVSYGWEVDSADAPKALDMWIEYVGEDNALEDIAQTQGTDSLSENIEYIARNFDVSDTIEQVDDVWERHELLRELLGVHTYLQNLTAAMGYDELAECLVEIFRMNDFREWDELEVFSNRKITSGKRTVDHTKPSREEVEKELDKHLAKAKVSFSKEMYDQTVDYILSFWDEIDYLPRSVYEAVHEWYLDTKQNFPEMLKPGKQQVASSAYRRFITSSRRRR